MTKASPSKNPCGTGYVDGSSIGLRLLYSFVVSGKPIGYVEYSRGAKGISKQVRAYWAYLKEVREVARGAGIPIPLVATEAEPMYIYTEAYFSSRVHSDPENVHKGIKDSLFYNEKQKYPPPAKSREKFYADKYTCGTYELPLYDKTNPRVVIEICSVKSKLAGK